jgi:hypothetical protein
MSLGCFIVITMVTKEFISLRVLPATADTHCQSNKPVLLSHQIAFDRLNGISEQRH